MNIVAWVVGKKVGAFVAGAAAGLILPPLLKSKIVRKAAVAVTAKGMALKDDAVIAYDSIKEEAQDIYAEAKCKKETADVSAPQEA